MDKEIYNKIDKYDIISFDIFDTLIKRNVEKPIDVFSLVEYNYNNFFPDNKINNYKEIRISAEKNARYKKIHEEITLEEISNELKTFFDIDVVNRLIEIEKNIEVDICVSNKKIKKIFDYCKEKKKTIIIITDMYLDLKTIETILNKNDIKGYKKIYLSSEKKKTKYHGTMFDYIISDLKIDKKQILHIGDNKRSDYLIPKRKGIDVIHIKNEIKKVKNEISFEVKTINTFIENCGRRTDNNYFYNFGYEKFGPLLYSFSRWIEKELLDNKLNRVFFLSRDGYIMEKAFNLLNDNIETHYLYASRRALAVPTLWMLNNVDEMLKTSFVPDIISLKAIFKKMGLEIEQYTDVIEQYNLKIDSKINIISDRKKLYEILEILEPKIRENSYEEYNNLLKYWEQENFNGDIAIVDIGWYGNMQKAINRIIDKGNININLKGYYVGLVPNSEKDNKKGYIFDKGLNEELFRKEKNFNSIFEMIFLAPHGSVKKFNNNNNKIEVELYDYEYKDSIEEENVKKIQEGALQFIKDYNKSELSKLINLKSKDAFMNLMLFGNNPTFEDSKNFGDFLFYDNDIRYIAKPKKLLFYIFHLKKLKNDFLNSQWKIGFLKRLLRININYEKVCEILRMRYEKIKEKKYEKNI